MFRGEGPPLGSVREGLERGWEVVRKGVERVVGEGNYRELARIVYFGMEVNKARREEVYLMYLRKVCRNY